MSMPLSNLTSPSRTVMSRIILGVTSIGAAIGIFYFLYSRKKKTENAESDTSSSFRKKKRMSSGEKIRVTFSDKHEIIETSGSSVFKDELENGEICASDEEQEHGGAKARDTFPSTKVVVVDDGDCGNSNSSSETIVDESVNGRTELRLETAVPASSVVDVSMGVVDNHDASAAAPETSPPPPPTRQIDQKLKPAITPETDYDRSSINRELKINRDFVPLLIGKRGANIKEIQQASNTIIKFQEETLEDGDRVCLIRGTPHDVTIAESLIEKCLLAQPVTLTQTIHVPNSAVGRIIGKGGESIRQIQDLSRARVNVDTGTHNFHRGSGDAKTMVLVTIRGTEEQIECAKEMITDKVEEEKSLRRNIEMITQSRAPRRAYNASTVNPAKVEDSAVAAINGNSPNSGILEVFVSCAYHPNDFWIQVMGRESVELDKLTQAMSEWYSGIPEENLALSVGQIIAAPFDVDGKMYRGKVVNLFEDDGTVEVGYVDYGDKRIISQSEVRRIHPEFLKLRFQAFQATLNLGCVGERWTDDAIVVFCDKTYCAQWQSLTARVKDYVKISSDSESKERILWVELFDKEKNIGNELIDLGFAVSNDCLPPTSSTDESTSSHNGNRKSYASVVADEHKHEELEVENDNAGAADNWVNGNGK